MARPALLVAMLFAAAAEAASAPPCFGLPPSPSSRANLDRRGSVLQQAGSVLASAALLLGPPALVPTTAPAPAAAAHAVDYTLFKKQLFNTPPGLLQFPPWMEGEWDAAFTFVGADFPSSVPPKAIPKDRITADTSLPGFRRLSIAMVPDVGKPHAFRMRFESKEDEGAQRVEEDRSYNLKEALESEVGKGAVTSIDYNPSKNPNRLTINLLPQATANAQKIELFCNSRFALPPAAGEEALTSFRYVEDIRQVSITPRLAETTTIGDYRHVWELYKQGDVTIRGFLSTVAYSTPQDPIFQLGAFAPLVVYFHTITLTPATKA